MLMHTLEPVHSCLEFKSVFKQIKEYNMKTKIYNIAILFVLLFGACTNLDPIWYDKVTPETFYKTEKDIYSAMGRPFTHFNWYLGDTWIAQEATTDHFCILTKGVNFGGDFERLQHHDWDPNVGWVANGWSGATMGITLCLDVIGDLETINYQNLGLTEANRADHIAQLKTLMAYFYMRGLDFYGGMPIYETIDDKTLKPRNTDQETFDFIENLLKDALTKLPELSWADKSVQDIMITKGAAAAILAELYFNAESYIGKPMYTECAAICKDIIDKKYGDYELDANWYGPHTFSNNKSKEVLWLLPSERNKMQNGNYYLYAFHYHSQGFRYFGDEMLGGAMNATSMQPSRKPTGDMYTQFKLGKPYEKFNDKDLRKKPYKYLGNGLYEGMFIVGDFKTPSGEIINGVEEYKDRPLVFVDYVGRMSEVGPDKPYKTPADLPSTVKNGEENSGVRIVKVPIPTSADSQLRWGADRCIIRLAEIYYTLAECKWRAGDVAGAVKLINDVRARNFENKEDPDPVTIVNLDKYRLIDEWGTEFLGEGRRRTDLIRWGMYATENWWDHTATNNKNINRFPIASGAISGNNLLQQNPGPWQ